MKPGGILLKIMKMMFMTAVVWSAVFLLAAALPLLEAKALDFWVNIFELACGLTSGVLLLLFARLINDGFIITGTALAVFSWTLGQLYWFCFTSITGEILPYPSVGDMGFTGTYFLLIGVTGLLPVTQHTPVKRNYRFVSLVILAAPIILSITGKNKIEALIYNFILALAATIAVYKAFTKLETKKYRLFAEGIILLGIADFAFMISASLFPQGFTFISDALYTVSIPLIAYGVMKGGLSSDD